jgi:membrane protein YdbS with pleckstrin-like domain
MAFANYQIEVADLPSLDQVNYAQHPMALRTKQLITATIILAILLVTPMVFLFVWMPLPLLISSGTWILIAASIYISILKGFPLRGYAVREHDITYRKGWIFRSRTTIPLNRIQHSEINQGPLDRKFNISSLKIFTAGGSASDLVIPGLLPQEAQRLHEFISNETARDV